MRNKLTKTAVYDQLCLRYYDTGERRTAAVFTSLAFHLYFLQYARVLVFPFSKFAATAQTRCLCTEKRFAKILI